MPKNEDGEFELVLGNTQLLTMFFVVVVLLAVFFVMGYVVGRNSAPLVTAEAARKPEAKPLVVDSPAPKPPTAEPTATPAPAASASPVVTPAPAAAAHTPAEKPPAPVETAKAETPKTEPPSKTEPPPKKAAEKTEPAKTAKAAPAQASAEPVAGAIYLQLSATGKADADKYVELLHKNGFPAVDKEVPEKLGTFRVLVGPIPPGDYNKVKADLQSKGLPGDKAFKQKF